MALTKNKKGYAKHRQYKKKGVSMKLVADRLKITKCHKPTGLDTLYPFGNTNATLRDSIWYHYPLANITAAHNATEQNVGDNFLIDNTKRESSRIFHKNSQIEFVIIPAKNYLEPIQYRYVCGYFKGDDNAGTQQLTNQNLEGLFPRIHSRMKTGLGGRNDFYFTNISRAFTITPKMIYDSNGSDDAQGSERMEALWIPKSHKLNMRCNKIRQYESDESDSLDGWYPFFAIQCVPVPGASAFNAPDIISDTSSWSGLQTATPQVQLEIRTWFQDIN